MRPYILDGAKKCLAIAGVFPVVPCMPHTPIPP